MVPVDIIFGLTLLKPGLHKIKPELTVCVPVETSINKLSYLPEIMKNMGRRR
jgi:hypothetical protein